MDIQYYQPQLELLLCRCRTVTNDWNYTHSMREPFWRLYWHSEKPAKLKFEGKMYELDSDTITLIAPETDFSPQMREPFEQFYIHFHAAYPFDNCQQQIFTFTLPPHLRLLIDRIRALLQKEEQQPSRQLALFTASLCLESLAMIPDDQLARDFTDQKMIIALDHIRRHYTAEVSNDELAEQVKMNRNAFIRFFRQHTGRTPQQYLREQRIREACLLLRFSGKTIDEIAVMTGFADRFYFSRVFKKIRGLNPAEFRNNRF